MKHLLNGVAIVAVLAIAAPVWAQRSGVGPGAPAPNEAVPGGPGPSSPMSNLPRTAPGVAYPAPSAAPPPAMAPGMAPGAMTSATPPMHRHPRHHGHVAAHHTTKGTPVSGNPNNSANQMNADELARLQGGNVSNPPASALPYATPPAGAMPPAH